MYIPYIIHIWKSYFILDLNSTVHLSILMHLQPMHQRQCSHHMILCTISSTFPVTQIDSENNWTRINFTSDVVRRFFFLRFLLPVHKCKNSSYYNMTMSALLLVLFTYKIMNCRSRTLFPGMCFDHIFPQLYNHTPKHPKC